MSFQCPDCSSQVSSNAVKCWACGFPITKSKTSLTEPKELDLSPLMITYQSPIARQTFARPQAKIRLKFIEDHELPQTQDDLSCLQCGGGITADDINCSNCKTLIMRRYCSHCSRLIPDHASVCPLCNKSVNEHFSYSKLRRTKILISAGTAAIFVCVALILFLQKSPSKTTVAEADVVRKPEIHLQETKSGEAQQEARLPQPPVVHKPVPPPTGTKIELSAEGRQPIKKLLAKQYVKPEVKQPEPDPMQIAKEEEPKQFAKVQDPPMRPMLAPALQRTVDLKSQQRVLKGRSLNHKGYALIKAGRPYDAIPILEQAVRSFPESKKDLNYAYALFNLAVAYRMAGKPEMAIPILQERIKINDQRDVVARELLSAKRAAGLSGTSENDLN
jgi:hypothetical protein